MNVVADGHAATCAGWEAARARLSDQVVERRLRFAGRPVRVRAVGRDLAERELRHFAHLRADGDIAEPELRLDIWDVEATGVDATTERSAGGPIQELAPGVTRYVDGGSCTDYRSADGGMVGWRANARSSPMLGHGKPLPVVLQLWYLDRSIPFVHAGLVAADGVGVLLAGPSGSGKSTTALACAAAGMVFLGDDQVALENTPKGLIGHSVWSVACLTPRDLERRPELRCGATGSERMDAKTLVFLGTSSRVRTAASAPIGAVLLPRLNGGSSSRLREVSGAGALRHMAPSSVSGEAVIGGRRAFQALGRLVERAPAIWLECGTDLPGVVREVARAVELVR